MENGEWGMGDGDWEMGNGEWGNSCLLPAARGLPSRRPGFIADCLICDLHRDSSLALRMTGPAGEWGCEKMIKHFFTAPNHRNAVLLMNPKAASRTQPEADCFRLCMQ